MIDAGIGLKGTYVYGLCIGLIILVIIFATAFIKGISNRSGAKWPPEDMCFDCSGKHTIPRGNCPYPNSSRKENQQGGE